MLSVHYSHIVIYWLIPSMMPRRS